MISTIRFLIPNLDRRPDRWKHCYEALLNRGVPAQNIERLPAIDGIEYLDTYQNHANLRIIKAHVASLFNGNLPPFLESDRDIPLTGYAWNSTWHLGLLNIARQSQLVCWILDDVKLDVDYQDLVNYAQILHDVSLKRDHPFLAIQLNRFPHSTTNVQPVRECPIFQYGFSGAEDYAFVFAPLGAMWMLETANQRAYTKASDPTLLTSKVRNLSPGIGFFGVAPDIAPTLQSKGLISLFKGTLNLTSLPQYKCCTDRNISETELANVKQED